MRGPVLLADDSAVVRLSVARRLRERGLEVLERASAAEASAADPSALACALLDLDLGDGGGDEVAARLRSRAPGLPVAVFTTATGGAAHARAAALGPVFAKPDDLDGAVDWVARQVQP